MNVPADQHLGLPGPLAQAPDAVVAAYQALSTKLRAFALALPLAPTQEAAALQAGYAPSTARKKAAAMAADPGVRAVVDWCVGSALHSSSLSIERLMSEIEAIAHADPRQLFDAEGNLRNMATLPDNIAKAVSGFEFGKNVKVTLWNKLDAIEKALKLLNAYPEKKDSTPQGQIIGVVIVPQKEHREADAIEGVSRRVSQPAPSNPQPPGMFRLLQD